MAAASPLVELQGIAARVGVTTIVRDVSFELDPGEVVGLFGANGAGKTTLLRIIATLLVPTQGSGTVLGSDVTGSDRFEVRPSIGLIGHEPALYPELTIRENLDFVATITATPSEEVESALEAVGLTGAADRLISACSYGMRRRVEFAREIMRRPRLLLLDEPHTALDQSSVGLVDHLVGTVTASGGGAVLVSHDRDRVEKLAGRSVELAGGTLR